MKKPMSGGEAEAFVRKAYDRCLEDVEYLDGENADDARMREMFVLNLEYFMATLLEKNVAKRNRGHFAVFLLTRQY